MPTSPHLQEQIGWNVANNKNENSGYGYGGGTGSGIHSPPPQYAAPLPPPSISSASGLYPAPNVPTPTDRNTYEIPTNNIPVGQTIDSLQSEYQSL